MSQYDQLLERAKKYNEGWFPNIKDFLTGMRSRMKEYVTNSKGDWLALSDFEYCIVGEVQGFNGEYVDINNHEKCCRKCAWFAQQFDSASDRQIPAYMAMDLETFYNHIERDHKELAK